MIDNNNERIHHAYWELTMLLFLDINELVKETNRYVAVKKNFPLFEGKVCEALSEAVNSLNLLIKELNIDLEIKINTSRNDDSIGT